MKNLTITNNAIDDSTLWNHLKAGDEKAFSSLFEKYYGFMVQYGNSFSPFTEKIQDCVQYVFTAEQIADILQVNYQSANNLLHRVLVNLRKEWKENLPLLMLLSSNFFLVFFNN